MVDLLADSLTIAVDRGGQRLVLTGPDDIMTQIHDANSGGLFGLGRLSNTIAFFEANA